MNAAGKSMIVTQTYEGVVFSKFVLHEPNNSGLKYLDNLKGTINLSSIGRNVLLIKSLRKISMTDGVPQGKHLASLLLLILINDLSGVVHHSKTLIYADKLNFRTQKNFPLNKTKGKGQRALQTFFRFKISFSLGLAWNI